MLQLLAQHQRQVARPDDQNVVEALATPRPDEVFSNAFGRGARTGVRMMRMSVPSLRRRARPT